MRTALRALLYAAVIFGLIVVGHFIVGAASALVEIAVLSAFGFAPSRPTNWLVLTVIVAIAGGCHIAWKERRK